MKTTPEIIDFELLKKGDDPAFENLYSSCFPMISSFVNRNKGNAQDAEDIFQETVIIFLAKIRKPDFQLTSSVSTYLFAIAKNLWLKKLRDSKRHSLEEYHRLQTQTESAEIEALGNREQIVVQWLAKVTERCQRILKAIFFLNEPMDQLMKKMGWKNKHTASNQQYKCIQQVRKVKDR